MKLTIVLIITLCITTVLLVSGCDKQSARKEQILTEQNQSHLLEVQPPVKLQWSLERDQINRRTTLWNERNKVSYIYLISYGKVLAFYAVQGKVSSVNSQITNPSQKVYGGSGAVLPSPAEDGSYGTNGDAIFFFLTDGTYIEWAGEYMLCDKPLTLSTPPIITYTMAKGAM